MMEFAFVRRRWSLSFFAPPQANQKKKTLSGCLPLQGFRSHRSRGVMKPGVAPD